jgi:hypothetical protein
MNKDFVYLRSLIHELEILEEIGPLTASVFANSQGGDRKAWSRWLSGRSPAPGKVIHWLEFAVEQGGVYPANLSITRALHLGMKARRDGLPILPRMGHPEEGKKRLSAIRK